VPNPAFVAYANLARLLNAATFQKRVNPELGRRAYVLLFKSPTYVPHTHPSHSPHTH
jgi:hypothetical protein